MITLPGVLPSEEVIRRFEKGKHMLSFSCGKDGVAAWLAMRDRVEIIPFYMELVPGLEFVEESIAYYERFFGRPILRVPNPSMYRMLDHCIFQPPARMHMIDRWGGFAQFDHLTLEEYIAKSHGLNPYKTWTATGVRCADSVIRRAHFKRNGPIVVSKRKFYPVWDWQIDDLVATLKKAAVKLPIDYKIFGRSFDGLDFRFLAPIKKHFPRDYERILEWFPLAELELKRFECRTL